MIWSLPGVCRNLKKWSTVVKSPCARIGSFREFHCWIPKEANKHLSAFPFRYFNRKRIHNTRGILSNWKFASAAKCSSFSGLGREVKPYRRRPSDLHFTQDIYSMKWNDCFPLIVSLFLLYDCRHLKNYCFISFQNIIFLKKSMTYTGLRPLTKLWVMWYQIQSQSMGYLLSGCWPGSGAYEAFKTIQAVTIPLGCLSHLVLRPTTEHTLYLDPRTWTNQAEDDLEASTLMAIFP